MNYAAGNKLPVMTFQADGRVGIGTLQPTSGSCGRSKQTILLDVNGLIRASGSLVTSDRRFKQDVETIPNSLELIRRLRGTTYTFKPVRLTEVVRSAEVRRTWRHF
jgi:hypothetical protein